MADYDVIIVGGGHNGLICAAYLARGGARVLLLERRAILGGACVTEEIPGAPGHRVSTGAAQLANLRPEIVAELGLERFGYRLLLPDPLSLFPQPDGHHLALWRDPGRTLKEIRKFSDRDAQALPEYQEDCRTVLALLEPLLYADVTPTMNGIEDTFGRAGRRDLFHAFIRGSIRALLDDRFESDAVKGMLGLAGTFGTNAGPDTPGTAYVMTHHMFGGTTGVKGRAGYVAGGMGGLADVLARAAAHFGAALRTGAAVAEIVVRDGAARGVLLANGERIAADRVVSNVDPQRTFLGLVGSRRLSPGFTDAIRGIQMQGVSLKVNCALRGLPRFAACPDDVIPARVSICPSLDDMATAWDEARRGRPSARPFMTVHMQSAIDETLAPAGGHTLTCYAQYFPYRLAPGVGDWEALRANAGTAVLNTLAEFAPDLFDRIIATEVLTPRDLERRFAMTGGHQNHGDLLPGRLFDERPAPGCDGARTPIDGLYLCGAGAHPGGCVWGAPGQRAARAILVERRDAR